MRQKICQRSCFEREWIRDRDVCSATVPAAAPCSPRYPKRIHAAFSASFVESDLSHATFFGATSVSTARFDRVLGMNTVKGLDRKTLAAALLLQG